MITINGTITINNVSDKQMELIWGYKARHDKAFGFTPNVMQPFNSPHGTVYNNVQFGYTKLHGLNLIAEVVNVLTKDDAKAVGQ